MGTDIQTEGWPYQGDVCQVARVGTDTKAARGLCPGRLGEMVTADTETETEPWPLQGRGRYWRARNIDIDSVPTQCPGAES